jgi:DNA-binding FrmR family transcriptional regulator
MAHLHLHQKKLIARIRRIRGQAEAIERALAADEEDCAAVLNTITACRGALAGLMAEVIEGHVRHHILDPDGGSKPAQVEAAEQLLAVVHSYLR